MNYLGNLSYTLTMISEELNISPTMVNNYLDSYIVVPKITLPEWLGIDEYHSPSLAYKNSVYICMMIDGKTNTLNDVLGSRSKIHLGNYLSAFPREEREKVVYIHDDNTAQKQGTPKSPHVRRSHFHSYWTGSGDDKQLIVKWVNTIFVKGDSKNRTTIHDIK